MKVMDIGVLKGPILLYGGPYSNLQASLAMFDLADESGISQQNRICTGDVVAYCADAMATVAVVRARGGTVIAGNCERQLSLGAEDCGCGFVEGSVCSKLSVDWYSHAAKNLTEAARRWMAGLPDMVTFTQAGKRIAVLHGGISDIARYIWNTSESVVFEQEIELVQAEIGPVDMIIAGHCGVPFERQIGSVTWVNPGVIGMPAHDGDTRTRYGILTGGVVEIHSLSYDFEAAANAMAVAGLPTAYRESLRQGYWPSEDILPEVLRRR